MTTETLKSAARRLSSSVLEQGFEPQALHVYTDSAGSALFWKIRLKNPTNGEKWIRPMRLNGNGYELGEPQFPDGKPLYNWAELVRQPNRPVLIGEGEQKCDALMRIGILATTSGSADSADRADWSPLAGRDVTIWPDFDSAGQRYASSVRERLLAIGCTVRIVDVKALSLLPKGDAVDWLAQHPGATAETVQALPIVAVESEVVPTAREWPEPQPLPEGLPAVENFNLELLPESFIPWIEDIATRMQCPPDFVAIPAMVALGSVIGRQVGICPQAKTNWMETANLWGMVIGRPGAMKSPAIESALAPLRRLAGKAHESFECADKGYQIEATAAKLRKENAQQIARAKLKKNSDTKIEEMLNISEPSAPVLRRYITNDCTAEALSELLRQNPYGLLVQRDELCSLLMSLDREDNANARGLFLSGWNGDQSYTTDRIGRGLNLHVKAVCISLLGSTQPGRISEYVQRAIKGGLGDDGLIQRFGLMIWPDNPSEWRNIDVFPNSKAAQNVFDIFERLSEINPDFIGAQRDNADKLPYLRFSAVALEMFTEWRTDLETRLREDLHPALESHFAKYRKLIPALSLINHLADVGHGPVSERATAKAVLGEKYLRSHAERVYFSGLSIGTQRAQTILKRIRKGNLPIPFTPRDIQRKEWSGLSQAEEVADALQLLVEYDWLLEEIKSTGGRPSKIYQINPRGLA